MLVGVRGEIDLFSAPGFRDYVCTRISPEGQFILDMSKVDFIGTAGLSVLDTVHATNVRDGRTWAMICGRPVYRLLRAGGPGVELPLLRFRGQCPRGLARPNGLTVRTGARLQWAPVRLVRGGADTQRP